MLTDKSCMTNIFKHHFHVYKFNVFRISHQKLTKSQILTIFQPAPLTTSMFFLVSLVAVFFVAQHLGSQPPFPRRSAWTVGWWPSHWSPAFRHCSSHVLMAMPLRDRHARRSVVTLRLKLCKKMVVSKMFLCSSLSVFAKRVETTTLIFGNHWKTSNVEVKHLWWWFG